MNLNWKLWQKDKLGSKDIELWAVLTCSEEPQVKCVGSGSRSVPPKYQRKCWGTVGHKTSVDSSRCFLQCGRSPTWSAAWTHAHVQRSLVYWCYSWLSTWWVNISLTIASTYLVIERRGVPNPVTFSDLMVKPVWNLSESVFFFEEMKGLSVDDCQRVFIFLFLLAAATLLYKHTKRRLSRVVQKLTKKKTIQD